MSEPLSADIADLSASVMEQCDGKWMIPKRQTISDDLRALAKRALDLETALTTAQAEREEARRAFTEHTKVVGAFLMELYSTMVDPCADDMLPVKTLEESLLLAAVTQRQALADLTRWQCGMVNLYVILTGKECAPGVSLGLATSAVSRTLADLAAAREERDKWAQTSVRVDRALDAARAACAAKDAALRQLLSEHDAMTMGADSALVTVGTTMADAALADSPGQPLLDELARLRSENAALASRNDTLRAEARDFRLIFGVLLQRLGGFVAIQPREIDDVRDGVLVREADTGFERVVTFTLRAGRPS